MTSLAAVIWEGDSGMMESGQERYRRHANRGSWLRMENGLIEARIREVQCPSACMSLWL